MNYFTRSLALCGCALATGCASVSGGNTQKMYVQTQAQDGKVVDGADCSLSNDKGTWRIKSPGDTSITRSNKRMEVKCEKSPLPQGVVSVESATRGAMYGNIIIGGVVGAVIDHSSGAAYEYPEVVKVVMGRFTAMDQPKAATPAATAEAMKVARTRQEQASMQAAAAPPQVHVPSGAAAPASANSPTPAPMASGYARIDDVDAVPYLSDKGREDYRQWVGRPTPKAFAVATDGAWFGAWSLKPRDPSHPSDPGERAMALCQQRTKTTCMMYAVNGAVVWTKPLTNPAASVGRTHVRAVPPPSDYAVTNNADAVPVRGEGRARYLHYLTLPAPKAFAVYETGGWRFASDSPDAMTNLLDTCAREGRTCWLYSVDDKVVWREDVKQRVGRSDQLGSN